MNKQSTLSRDAIHSQLQQAAHNLDKLLICNAGSTAVNAYYASQRYGHVDCEAIAQMLFGRIAYIRKDYIQAIEHHGIANNIFRRKCDKSDNIQEKMFENDILYIKAMVAESRNYDLARCGLLVDMLDYIPKKYNNFSTKLRLWFICFSRPTNWIDDNINYLLKKVSS